MASCLEVYDYAHGMIHFTRGNGLEESLKTHTAYLNRFSPASIRQGSLFSLGVTGQTQFSL